MNKGHFTPTSSGEEYSGAPGAAKFLPAPSPGGPAWGGSETDGGGMTEFFERLEAGGRPRLLGYLVAVGAAGVAMLGRLALEPWLRGDHPFVPPLFAVVFA